jgi:(p)ppGpp synthase/HD superfamily hydrolase
MRTLNYMRPDSRKRIAEETLDIYAPLAGRMGMQEMREELDLSFRVSIRTRMLWCATP